MEKPETTFSDKANRFGGKLIYRTVSVVPVAMGLFAARGAYASYQTGGYVSLIILTAVAVLCLFAIRWCWSPKRTVGEFMDANS